MHAVVPDAGNSSRAGPSHALRVGSRLGGGRLHVDEVLGQGGMGIVYRAYDTGRQSQVALKTMNRLDPSSIYALKNEFRLLLDVHHPNLVRLFELFCEGEQWFFTMELVCGLHFDKWVRPEGRLDEQRLRSAFAQLVDAIGALHAHGKLHCDIKPTNTLVTEGGHVVVLDFGLVTEPQANAIGQTIDDRSVVGTPAYLAPEQGHGAPPTAASDVYALGVMLFEALTGQLPFSGTSAEVLVAKQQDAPAWPRALRRGAPEDLVALCDRMLERSPEHRPALAAVCEHFTLERRASCTSSPPASRPPPLRAAAVIGREHELTSMRQAYEASSSGHAVVLAVSGESGIGKTALCDAFLDELVNAGHAVVLRGRCNEQESVPFKAMDALIDSLSRHLRRLPALDAAGLLPRDAAALSMLFPVLGRVEAIARTPSRPLADPHAQQRRAFEALHELLGRMRDRRPLVIFIDDLQWTDRDSSLLLRFLLLHTEAVPALFVLSHRAELAAQNELLEAVLDAARSNRELSLRRLALAPLLPEASAALASQVLDGAKADVSAFVRRIGDEARGNPFLIGEFARFVVHTSDVDSAKLSLGAALHARVVGLSDTARKVLSLLSVAGHPLPLTVALAASGACHVDLDALQSAHLTRWTSAGGEKKLELYHDRIRESFRELIAPEDLKQLYGALASACSGRAEIDPDTRCAYLEGAGDLAGAAACAAEAADQAACALAFDHAAHLYHKALELGAYSVRTGLHLTSSWASALANAGRSEASADAYECAALLAHGDEHLELRRRSAEQLLIAGHAADGLARIDDVCASVGLRRRTGSRLDHLGSKLSLGKLRLLGLPVSHLGPRPIDQRGALRLELLQTAVVGLQVYSQAGATEIALDYLHEAQRRCDARHIVWALGSLAIHLESTASYTELLAHMSDISERDGRPELRGLVYGLRGFLARRSGKNREARGWFARALASYSECVGMQWQIDMMHVHDQASASSCGDYAELARTTPALVEDSFQRGRIWTGATLSGFWGMPAWVAQDDAAGYRRQLERARSRWRPLGSFLKLDRTTYGLLRAEVMLSIYEQSPLSGLALLEQAQSASQKPTHRRDHDVLRGLCGVAALGCARAGRLQGADLPVMRALVRRSATLLHSPVTRPFAHMFDAALALDAGELDSAARELTAAGTLFESLSMTMLVAGIRRRLGQLLGGERGRALVAHAEAFMREQAVQDLEALTEVLCPGCAPSR